MTDTTHKDLSSIPAHAIALLEQLCRQPAIAALGQGMAEMADLTEELLQAAGFNTRQLLVDGAPPVVYGEQRGRSPYTLLLYNHYDVQPADPLELWHTPPFVPTVRDGKFYARGAADNKGEIAARLAAIHTLRAVNGELPLTIRWIIEGEEEIGSPHFATVAERYADLLQADGCLWEGQGFDVADRPQLILGTKGLLYVQLELQCAGVDAHSMVAPIVPSAAWNLIQALATLRTPEGYVRIPGFYDAVRPPTPAQLAALLDQPDLDDYQRQAYQVEQFVDGLRGVALRERQAFSPTCNIAGLLSGYTGSGVKTVLPAKAMCKIDFRLVPDQDPHDILAKLSVHLVDAGYADIKLTCLGAAPPVATPLDHPFVQRIAAVATSFHNQRPSVTPLLGGTLPLLGALQRYVGVPGLAAPGNPIYWASGMHAPDEHIRLSDLERAVHFNCHMFQTLATMSGDEK